MVLFKKKRKTTEPIFTRLYQYSSGDFLLDTSQPNPDENYEITTRQYTPHKSTRYFNVTIGSNGLAQRRGKNGNLIECDRTLPELYDSMENCCGCTACFAICPAQAIAMRPCEEGFLYPVVDAEKCIRCYKCLSVCPIKTKDNNHKKGVK